jgi:hypothetical protein
MTTTPSQPSGTVDFGRSFTLVSEDPRWIGKVLIGGVFVLLSALLVGIPFLAGYYGRTLRHVARGEARPLPDWEDLGGLFAEGLQLTGVYLVHLLVGITAIFALAAVVVLPVALSGGLPDGGPGQLLAAFTGLGLAAVYGLVMLLSLSLAVYMPAALARVAMGGSFGDGFDWRRNVEFIRANAANYLLALLVYLLAAFAAQFGFLLCCIGVFPAAFWSHVTGAVALGQVVRLNPDSL